MGNGTFASVNLHLSLTNQKRSACHVTSAAILDSVLRGNTGKMAKDKEKRAVWTEQQEDMLMDLFEDNEGLYKTGEKAYSNRESKYAVLLRISHIFPGKTGKYLYYRPAALCTLMVESVNLL